MNQVSVSFRLRDKTVTLTREGAPEEDLRQVVHQLLAEIEAAGLSRAAAAPEGKPSSGRATEANAGRATAGQLRALWGKALAKGWEREKVKKYLEDRLGTSQEKSIVEEVDRAVLSGLISEIEKA